MQVDCIKSEDAHCGWAWGTVYSGVEEPNGIDELGYLSAEGLLEEVLSWRLMIVPVLRTTGVNTKILVALELGIPLVITPVAASPFDIPENETIVAFADQALDFVQQTVAVYTVSWLWTTLSRASRQHWENLATHDPARNDVRAATSPPRLTHPAPPRRATHPSACYIPDDQVRVAISTLCFDTNRHNYLRTSSIPRLPVPNEPEQPVAVLPPSCARTPPGSAVRYCPAAGGTGVSAGASASTSASGLGTGGHRCLDLAGASANSSGAESPLPQVLLVGAHAPHHFFPKFVPYVFEVWRRVCAYCGMTCVMRREGEPYALGEGTELLLDAHWSLPLERLDQVSHRLVFYSWDPGKLGRYFHYSGNLLESVSNSEMTVAQANLRPVTALSIRMNQEMRSSGGFIYSWRKALLHLGFSKPAINKLVESEITRFEANWTRDFLAHMAAYKSG